MDQELIIPIKRLPNGRDLPLPAYQTLNSVGLDLHAAVETDIKIEPQSLGVIPCGFAIAVPEGYEAQVRPRSGLSKNNRLSVLNSPGTIDPDYRGEVTVLLFNHGTETFVVSRGMRVAQMLILPIPRVSWTEVEELPPSTRGTGGFGHTGH